MKWLFLIFTLIFRLSAIADQVQMITLQNGYQVWTKRVGHGQIKILTLHGGPGSHSEYIEASFQNQFPQDQYEVIYYDQLGSFRSDHPNDLNLWRVERFLEEVEEVREALGLDQFYLYGQSWGGMLAIEYALKYQEHLKGLILSNTPGSISSYENYIQQLRLKLPQEVQDELSMFEDRGELTHPRYQQLMIDRVYNLHLCRMNPWPEAVANGIYKINTVVYETMGGPNEFVVTGNYKNWNRWNDFAKIQVPTLVISGLYDTISPEDTMKIASLIPQGTYKICEECSHFAQFEDPHTYFQALKVFLKSSYNQF